MEIDGQGVNSCDEEEEKDIKMRFKLADNINQSAEILSIEDQMPKLNKRNTHTNQQDYYNAEQMVKDQY